MSSKTHQLHIFFFPFMAQGHIIPMIDIARLFATRGTKSTIITTPLNALHFAETIDRDKQSGLDIQIQTIPFPSKEVGLPQGCEDQGSVPTQELMFNFLQALDLLQPPFEKLLGEIRPDCVVSDMFLTWTTDVSKKFGIPRLVFHGTCYFALCIAENIQRFSPQEKVESDMETFTVPGLPDKIEMTRSEMPDRHAAKTWFAEMQAKVAETEVTSYGVLVNSFYEMEPAYAEYYKKDMGRKAWNIGPVSLCNRNFINKAHRGKKAAINEHVCLNWLDKKEPDSVLYISFGSIARIGAAQLVEIAKGLEASNVPFIWVIRTHNDENQSCLPEGFEQRIEGKGLIIKGWAPQVLILDHPSVGGFMTHCGWNSTFEAICARVPLITWPQFAEQFHIEKLVTKVLKIGIEAGNKVWNTWMEPEDVCVTKEKIEEVVTRLMGNGEESEERRHRAKELGKMTKKAVEGGSSYNDLTALIEELRTCSKKLH